MKTLSSDASVAGIRTQFSIYDDEAPEGGANYRAVLWSGINWSEEVDLGTLRENNSGMAQINALSADGTIAGGWANNSYSLRYKRATIWSGSNWSSKTDLEP